MQNLNSHQKKYLKGLAHGLKPVVFIGHKGITDTVVGSSDEALKKHELIKVKFGDFKEKIKKKEIAVTLATTLQCHLVGIIGHIAILYRPQSDPKKRKIKLPDYS